MVSIFVKYVVMKLKDNKMARKHSKSNKIERGLGRKVETGACADDLELKVQYWVKRIDLCGISYTLRADVLKELIAKIKSGNEDREVIEVLVKRRNLNESLKLASFK